MKPYWESKLTVKEAQDLSEDGVAIFGNPVMRDVVWEKSSPYPMIWIGKGYKQADPQKFCNRKGWIPAKPYYESEFKSGVIYTNHGNKWVEKIPKPIKSKWKLDETRNVYRYEKDGSWAEVDASIDPDGDFYPTKLFIKGELKEFIDYGWAELQDSMDYCEWQVDHPDGFKVGWVGTICRLAIIATLATLFIYYPLQLVFVYCVLSYIVIGYMLIMGELTNPISGLFLWLLSPIYFAFIIVASFIKPPIL